MGTFIIAAVLFGYAAFVIRRKIKDMKNGKFCSCACGDCKNSCGKPKAESKE